MITIFQAIVIGLVQGLTELFPTSSLGHSVIIPSLFGWHNIGQNGSSYLTFLVATHFATALVLFCFFWKEWVKIIKGTLRSLSEREIKRDDTYAKLGWLLVAGTIPAGILGLLFQQSIAKLITSAEVASILLIANGCVLLLAEKLRRSHNNPAETTGQSDKNISRLHLFKGGLVGVIQSFALFPGISRSGTSMAGGLIFGLNNEDAARFSFLLATPIIGAAAALKLPEVFSGSYDGIRLAIFLGSLAAGLSAYLSVKFLVRYFKTRTLSPFALYCLFGGLVYFGYLYFSSH